MCASYATVSMVMLEESYSIVYGNHILKTKIKLLTHLPITLAMYYNALVLAIGLRIEERKLSMFGLAIAPQFTVPGKRAHNHNKDCR